MNTSERNSSQVESAPKGFSRNVLAGDKRCRTEVNFAWRQISLLAGFMPPKLLLAMLIGTT
jgi:hypothetical protein